MFKSIQALQLFVVLLCIIYGPAAETPAYLLLKVEKFAVSKPTKCAPPSKCSYDVGIKATEDTISTLGPYGWYEQWNFEKSSYKCVKTPECVCPHVLVNLTGLDLGPEGLDTGKKGDVGCNILLDISMWQMKEEKLPQKPMWNIHKEDFRVHEKWQSKPMEAKCIKMCDSAKITLSSRSYDYGEKLPEELQLSKTC